MILNPPYTSAREHKVTTSHVLPGEPGTTTLLPLGGCGEFGRNMTAVICDGEFYLIDCGILFSDETHHGISGVFYDITPLVQRYGPPQAYLITHAHRDHIGSLAYFLDRWPAPVFATPWTIEYIKADLSRSGLSNHSRSLREVAVGAQFQAGRLSCEYIAVNHSIPESQSLFIQTPYRRIAHSGDFKIDLDSSLEDPCDLTRWQEIARESPVDILLCDSTNAHQTGRSPSEEATRESLDSVMKDADGRIFIATFSSNLWRLIHIIEAAKAHGRPVEVLGLGMQKSLAMAKSFGLYHGYNLAASSDRRTSANQLSSNGVYVVSGSQMEPGSVLNRILEHRFGNLKIGHKDTVVFSSRTIPGHEKVLIKAISQIKWQGARVITYKDKKNIHVSGHGYGADIDILESLIRPRYFIPIHGELSHLMANAFGRQADVFLWKNMEGCLLRGNQIHPFSFPDTFKNIYVDQDLREISDTCLRQRRRLAAKGLLWVTAAYYLTESRFVCGPSFDSTGLSIDSDLWQESLTTDLTAYLKQSIEAWLEKQASEKKKNSIDSFVAARIESYLQQTYSFKSWVRAKIWLV